MLVFYCRYHYNTIAKKFLVTYEFLKCSTDMLQLSCNSGCRADASEAAIVLLPSNITVFTLDFSGSGLSEGEHVTLGWNEVSAYLIN